MKKIIKIALVTFFVTIIGYNIYSYKQSVEVVSDLVLANVEALAHFEGQPQKDHGIVGGTQIMNTVFIMGLEKAVHVDLKTGKFD